MRLSELKTSQRARISQVHQYLASNTPSGTAGSEKDSIATRLTTLGFVPGEYVEIVTKGLFGGEPILVKVGYTRFALRLNEAERIEVEV